jgi:plasmid replication initiation protein
MNQDSRQADCLTQVPQSLIPQLTQDRMNYRLKALIYRAGVMPISRNIRIWDRCVRQPGRQD